MEVSVASVTENPCLRSPVGRHRLPDLPYEGCHSPLRHGHVKFGGYAKRRDGHAVGVPMGPQALPAGSITGHHNFVWVRPVMDHRSQPVDHSCRSRRLDQEHHRPGPGQRKRHAKMIYHEFQYILEHDLDRLDVGVSAKLTHRLYRCVKTGKPQHGHRLFVMGG